MVVDNDVDAMLHLLLLFSVFLKGNAQCKAGFADPCFNILRWDLHFMPGIRHESFLPVTNLSKVDAMILCRHIDYSLKCISRKIDSDCTVEDGSHVFHSWIIALRGVYHYVCDGQSKKLRDLFVGIRCWNVEQFFTCTKESAGFDRIADLFHTDLDSKECRKLLEDINNCHENATKESCREQADVKRDFLGMTEAFLTASHCKNLSQTVVSDTRDLVCISASSRVPRERTVIWVVLAIALVNMMRLIAF